MPTDAEWEYAARSGTTGNYAGNLNAMAWYWLNSGKHTHDVATKQSNAWNLYDMHGNVSEWCQDYFESYQSGTITDPTGTKPSGYGRSSRGGGWVNGIKEVYVTAHYNIASSLRINDVGFRILRQ